MSTRCPGHSRQTTLNKNRMFILVSTFLKQIVYEKRTGKNRKEKIVRTMIIWYSKHSCQTAEIYILFLFLLNGPATRRLPVGLDGKDLHTFALLRPQNVSKIRPTVLLFLSVLRATKENSEVFKKFVWIFWENVAIFLGSIMHFYVQKSVPTSRAENDRNVDKFWQMLSTLRQKGRVHLILELRLVLRRELRLFLLPVLLPLLRAAAAHLGKEEQNRRDVQKCSRQFANFCNCSTSIKSNIDYHVLIVCSKDRKPLRKFVQIERETHDRTWKNNDYVLRKSR